MMLTIPDLAGAIGVSVSSLKRWADDGKLHVTRTAGGHRRVERTEAIRFIRELRLPIVKHHYLGLDNLSGKAEPAAPSDTNIGSHLREGRVDAARAVIMAEFLRGRPVAEICDQIICPAMREIGKLWHQDEAGVLVEHRATDVCIQALSHIRTLLPLVGDEHRVAIGGSPEQDLYTLPSLMAATVLAAEGWRETNLGGLTPFETLGLAAERSGASLVWLAVSLSPRSESQFIKKIQSLADRIAMIPANLIVGGPGWKLTYRINRSNVFVAGSMAELVAYATGVGSVGQFAPQRDSASGAGDGNRRLNDLR